MTRWTMALLAAAVCAPATGAAAQQPAVVRGQVVDAGSGRPLAGAVVHIGDKHLAVTDPQGRFEVGRLVAGEYTVWATALGYGVGTAELEVPFDSVTVRMALDPDPVRLEAIVATASRFEARTRSYARAVRVFRTEDMRASTSADMREFLLWRTGLARIPCGPGQVCVRVRGRVQPAVVYVDEVRLGGGLDVLAAFRPWEIARVEVFGGGAQIRVYTNSFMDWAARRGYQPLPLSIAT